MKKKILIIDQIFKVNYKYSYNLAEELSKFDDILVEIIADEKKIDNNSVDILNYFNSTQNTNKINKVINYISSWNKILKKIKQDNIDVIHIQWFLLSPVDLFYLKKIKSMGKKIIVTIHDILPFNERFYDLKSHKEIYEISDEIIVQAKINKERLLEKFNLNENKVSYIPHGNFVNYGELMPKNEAKEHLNIDKSKKVILFFGQIKKVKGLHVLIDALKEVTEQYKDVLLVIAGKTFDEDFNTYETQIKNLNLESNVRCDIKFIPDEDVKYYFNASEFVVLPYLNIFQSGVIQLCYAHEKAPIATNVGGFPEVVIDNKTGVLVEANNSKALSEAIVNLLDNPEVASQLGINGKEFMETEFSWSSIAKKVKECYK